MSDKVLKVAMIGLDSSHTVEFARRMQDPEYTEMERVSGLKTVACVRFPSTFQSEPNQDERQKIMEGWGVKVTRNLDEAIADCDAIMIPINDPALHLEWFERCAPLGKPIFLDKPMADSIASGRRIAALAVEHKVPLFSTSSLRYDADFCAALATNPESETAYVFGPLGIAPAGSHVVWYGVHVFEMVVAALGTGALTVRASRDPSGLVINVSYPDDRRGIAELTIGNYRYGGVLRNRADLIAAYNVTGGAKFYDATLRKVEEFFRSGKTPVPVAETLEVMGLLDAADRASKSGNVEPVYV
jgi:hypothetical protein